MIILDINMPIKDGITAYKEIREFLPKIPIILSSGFDQKTVNPEILDDKNCEFLQKPYNYYQLREKISDFFIL